MKAGASKLLSHMLQVLKRRQKDGSSLIKVDQLRDGVVLFEDVADAERYSNYLEADNSSQVSCSTQISMQAYVFQYALMSMPRLSTCSVCVYMHVVCA